MIGGKDMIFNSFLKMSNELADFISVGSLFHSLAAVTVKRYKCINFMITQENEVWISFIRVLVRDIMGNKNQSSMDVTVKGL